ncbi:MAG TPA: hypothetical protein VFN35_11485, partial [Ktedonobacteraceae bacterium]|nr:hypothetical protein [Ktedonobacteraceae bacterium]
MSTNNQHPKRASSPDSKGHPPDHALLERIKELPLLWQSTLLRCSLHESIVDTYPLILFEAMLVFDFEEKARELMELLSLPESKAKIGFLLAHHLLHQPERAREGWMVFRQAIDFTRNNLNDYQQTLVLGEQIELLVEAQEWKEAEDLARSLEDPDEQTRALEVLVAGLSSARQWNQAEALALSMKNQGIAVQTLVTLAAALLAVEEWAEGKRILEQASLEARKLKNEDEQDACLQKVVSELVLTRQWDVAEELTQQIQHDFRQAETLETLASGLAQAQQWDQAERIALKIHIQEQQVKALARLATALAKAQHHDRAQQIFARAEEGANGIQDDYWQAEAQLDLSLALAEAQEWEKAERIARHIQDEKRRVQALITLISKLVRAQEEEEAQRLWGQLENLAGQYLKSNRRQARVLHELAGMLQQTRTWKLAEQVASSIRDEDQRAMALLELVTNLAKTEQRGSARHILPQIHGIIQRIQGAVERQRASEEFLSLLISMQEWDQAEAVAKNIQNKYEQTEALGKLALALDKTGQRAAGKRIFELAMRTAYSIQGSPEEANALHKLTTALIEMQEWETAEEIALYIPDTHI